jgi:uncharacterized DUF497 family protein
MVSRLRRLQASSGDPLSNTYSDQLKMLVVAHTDDGEEVRIVSAREATAGERKAYEED